MSVKVSYRICYNYNSEEYKGKPLLFFFSPNNIYFHKAEESFRTVLARTGRNRYARKLASFGVGSKFVPAR